MVSGNRGAVVAARVLPQVINILMDSRHFPAWVLSPKDSRGLLEAQGNGGRTQWMDPASVSEGLQTVDDSIGIKFKSSSWWVLSPHMPDSTGRWAEMGLDKHEPESGSASRKAFLTVCTVDYAMEYNVTRKKKGITRSELIWTGFIDIIPLKDWKVLSKHKGEKDIQNKQWVSTIMMIMPKHCVRNFGKPVGFEFTLRIGSLWDFVKRYHGK